MRLLLGAVNAGLGLMIFSTIVTTDGWRDLDSVLLSGLMIVTGVHLLTPFLARLTRAAVPRGSARTTEGDAVSSTE